MSCASFVGEVLTNLKKAPHSKSDAPMEVMGLAWSPSFPFAQERLHCVQSGVLFGLSIDR